MLAPHKIGGRPFLELLVGSVLKNESTLRNYYGATLLKKFSDKNLQKISEMFSGLL